MNRFSLLTAYLEAQLSVTGSVSEVMASEIEAAIALFKREGEGIIRNLSKLKSIGFNSMGWVEPFETKSFWMHGNNGITTLRLYETFEENILRHAPKYAYCHEMEIETLFPVQAIRFHEIIDEIGIVPFISIREYLACMKQLISSQPRGEKGFLLSEDFDITKREENVHYVIGKGGQIFQTSAKWGNGKWSFECLKTSDNQILDDTTALYLNKIRLNKIR